MFAYKEEIMSLKIVRLGLWIALLLVPVVVFAQDNTAPSHPNGSAKGPEVSATGCLQKGGEAGGYFLTGADGKTCELTGSKVNLADHVGHKVTVSGQQVQHSEEQEAKVATHEKAEAAGNQYADMHVSSLKMVSSSCQ